MDYYARLGVGRGASEAELKKAYRKLALRHHPDHGGDKSDFAKLDEAFKALMEPDVRRRYDRLLSRERRDDTTRTQTPEHSAAAPVVLWNRYSHSSQVASNVADHVNHAANAVGGHIATAAASSNYGSYMVKSKIAEKVVGGGANQLPHRTKAINRGGKIIRAFVSPFLHSVVAARHSPSKVKSTKLQASSSSAATRATLSEKTRRAEKHSEDLRERRTKIKLLLSSVVESNTRSDSSEEEGQSDTTSNSSVGEGQSSLSESDADLSQQPAWEVKEGEAPPQPEHDESTTTEAEQAMLAAEKRHEEEVQARILDYDAKRVCERKFIEQELVNLKEKQAERRKQREQEEAEFAERRRQDEEQRRLGEIAPSFVGVAETSTSTAPAKRDVKTEALQRLSTRPASTAPPSTPAGYLTHEGRVLHEGTLQEHCIGPYATLYESLRLRGGGWPPPVGIVNCGLTCYIGAALSQLLPLMNPDSTVSNDLQQRAHSGKVVQEYVRLMSAYWDTDRVTPLDPSDLKSAIDQQCNLFQERAEHDSALFVEYILDELAGGAEIDRMEPIITKSLDDPRRAEAASKYWQRILATRSRPFTEFFASFVSATTMCACGAVIDNYELQWVQRIPLPQQLQRPDLDDLLNRNFAMEKFTDAHFTCIACKEKGKGRWKKTSIWRLPKQLCVTFLRFAHSGVGSHEGIKLMTPVALPPNFTLVGDVAINPTYTIQSFATHVGEWISTGHYTATLLNSPELEINDAEVLPWNPARRPMEQAYYFFASSAPAVASRKRPRPSDTADIADNLQQVATALRIDKVPPPSLTTGLTPLADALALETGIDTPRSSQRLTPRFTLNPPPQRLRSIPEPSPPAKSPTQKQPASGDNGPNVEERDDIDEEVSQSSPQPPVEWTSPTLARESPAEIVETISSELNTQPTVDGVVEQLRKLASTNRDERFLSKSMQILKACDATASFYHSLTSPNHTECVLLKKGTVSAVPSMCNLSINLRTHGVTHSTHLLKALAQLFGDPSQHGWLETASKGDLRYACNEGARDRKNLEISRKSDSICVNLNHWVQRTSAAATTTAPQLRSLVNSKSASDPHLDAKLIYFTKMLERGSILDKFADSLTETSPTAECILLNLSQARLKFATNSKAGNGLIGMCLGGKEVNKSPLTFTVELFGNSEHEWIFSTSGQALTSCIPHQKKAYTERKENICLNLHHWKIRRTPQISNLPRFYSCANTLPNAPVGSSPSSAHSSSSDNSHDSSSTALTDSCSFDGEVRDDDDLNLEQDARVDVELDSFLESLGPEVTAPTDLDELTRHALTQLNELGLLLPKNVEEKDLKNILSCLLNSPASPSPEFKAHSSTYEVLALEELPTPADADLFTKVAFARARAFLFGVMQWSTNGKNRITLEMISSTSEGGEIIAEVDQLMARVLTFVSARLRERACHMLDNDILVQVGSSTAESSGYQFGRLLELLILRNVLTADGDWAINWNEYAKQCVDEASREKKLLHSKPFSRQMRKLSDTLFRRTDMEMSTADTMQINSSHSAGSVVATKQYYDLSLNILGLSSTRLSIKQLKKLKKSIINVKGADKKYHWPLMYEDLVRFFAANPPQCLSDLNDMCYLTITCLVGGRSAEMLGVRQARSRGLQLSDVTFNRVGEDLGITIRAPTRKTQKGASDPSSVLFFGCEGTAFNPVRLVEAFLRLRGTLDYSSGEVPRIKKECESEWLFLRPDVKSSNPAYIPMLTTDIMPQSRPKMLIHKIERSLRLPAGILRPHSLHQSRSVRFMLQVVREHPTSTTRQLIINACTTPGSAWKDTGTAWNYLEFGPGGNEIDHFLERVKHSTISGSKLDIMSLYPFVSAIGMPSSDYVTTTSPTVKTIYAAWKPAIDKTMMQRLSALQRLYDEANDGPVRKQLKKWINHSQKCSRQREENLILPKRIADLLNSTSWHSSIRHIDYPLEYHHPWGATSTCLDVEQMVSLFSPAQLWISDLFSPPWISPGSCPREGCNFATSDANALKTHIHDHSDSDGCYQCTDSTCSITVNSLDELKKHIRVSHLCHLVCTNCVVCLPIATKKNLQLCGKLRNCLEKHHRLVPLQFCNLLFYSTPPSAAAESPTPTPPPTTSAEVAQQDLNRVNSWSVEELAGWLNRHGIDENAVAILKKEGVDGEAFLLLNLAMMRSMNLLIGPIAKLTALIENLKKAPKG